MGVRQSPLLPLWHNELGRVRTVTDECGKPRSNRRNGGTKGGTEGDVKQGLVRPFGDDISPRRDICPIPTFALVAIYVRLSLQPLAIRYLLG